MKSPIIIGDNTFFNTLSIGISVYPTDDSDLDKIMLKADQALYDAKRNGKNTYLRYTK
ncbi:diguanylate cyclase domain-containing protein [Virgibacillus sp. DJP39]|uniref:diguanylate cyclase domain-containing protein n=1 Tax=Virgibacillus sp. DJP39 TaxID=3409790 RepID=UPI003BB608A8